VLALRPYQEQALTHLHAMLNRGERRLYFELPTGTGKTVILAHLARAMLPRGRVLAVAHRQELIAQLAAALGAVTGEAAGIVMGECDERAARVIVGTIQTLRQTRLRRVLDASPDPVALLLLDEAHHVTPENRYAALVGDVEEASPAVAVVGCTATPYRMDRHRMQDVLPVCAFARSVAEMQDGGWLAPLVWRRIEIGGLHLETIRSRFQAGERDFDVAELSAVSNRAPIVKKTVDATRPLLGDRPTLAFAVDVRHARALADAYRSAGYAAQTVWGEMLAADRARVLRDWQRGRVQVVTNCAVLTEGFDFPGIAALVMARPTQSPGFYVQCLGRGTRPARGKADCLVLDLTGHADPRETRQVLLPFITGTDPATGPRRLLKDGPPPIAHVLDPTGASSTAWGYDPATRSYVASADKRLDVALVSDPRGSGLFFPVLFGKDGAHRATEHPVPLREGVWHLQATAIRLGARALSSKRAWWRTDAPSPAQFQLLFRLDPEAHQRAMDEGWDKGTMSLWIGVAINRRRIEAFRQHPEVAPVAASHAAAHPRAVGDLLSGQRQRADSPARGNGSRTHTAARLGNAV